MQHLWHGNINREKVVCTQVVTSTVREISFGTEHDTFQHKVVAIVFIIGFQHEVDIQLHAFVAVQHEAHGNITTCRCDVCRHALLFLALGIIHNRVADAEFLCQCLKQLCDILHSFLLSIAHVAVCLVEVALHWLCLIVTKQCQLVVHLVDGIVNALCEVVYFSLTSCRREFTFDFACNSCCFACKSLCICCDFLLCFFSLLIAFLF